MFEKTLVVIILCLIFLAYFAFYKVTIKWWYKVKRFDIYIIYIFCFIFMQRRCVTPLPRKKKNEWLTIIIIRKIKFYMGIFKKPFTSLFKWNFVFFIGLLCFAIFLFIYRLSFRLTIYFIRLRALSDCYGLRLLNMKKLFRLIPNILIIIEPLTGTLVIRSFWQFICSWVIFAK